VPSTFVSRDTGALRVVDEGTEETDTENLCFRIFEYDRGRPPGGAVNSLPSYANCVGAGAMTVTVDLGRLGKVKCGSVGMVSENLPLGFLYVAVSMYVMVGADLYSWPSYAGCVTAGAIAV